MPPVDLVGAKDEQNQTAGKVDEGHGEVESESELPLIPARVE